MESDTVLIAGGGIGGLATALTLEQIGVPCRVFEAVSEIRPLGVGINLQPNAVRELYDLGFDDGQLDRIGLRTREWALVGLNGRDIYSEPRGIEAGCRWPQYSVHRGELQMMLYRAVCDRLGEETVVCGHRVTGYRNRERGVTISLQSADGGRHEVDGRLLIGADGLHSAVRAQMYPDQPPIQWGGAIMWRGVSPGRPIRSGASFVGLGTYRQRLVFYPISAADPASGLATINWIAEITVDNSAGWTAGDWTRRVEVDSFIDHFSDWRFPWLDVPGLLRAAEIVYEYPMIDRDPLPSWRDGNVALLGDAAHVMYPTGSNGASQAIVDARVLGARLLGDGIDSRALAGYDRQLCDEISAVVLRNRGAGPFAILNLVDERCGGVFESIDDVVPRAELDDLMARYKAAAGYAAEQLNRAGPTIAPGSRVG